MDFNTDVLFLFVNATLTTIISAGVVIRILIKEYRPTVKALEAERQIEAENSERTKVSS